MSTRPITPNRGTTREALRARERVTVGIGVLAVSIFATLAVGLVLGWVIFG
jgi:hypothetical protein